MTQYLKHTGKLIKRQLKFAISPYRPQSTEIYKEDVSETPTKMVYGQNACFPAEYSVQEPTSNSDVFLSTNKEYFKNVHTSIQHHEDIDCGLYVLKDFFTTD
uniref:Uncharacterized protein n=1 Tax=Glossina austeni TaxID=7395 RepID=A0A1A9VHX1_GLOAU